MKKSFYLLMIVFVCGFIFSCSKTPTYTELLKAEEKAIDRLFAEKGFEVLKNYPLDGKFKDDQFYKLDNDVYIQVVDTGNGRRATYNEEILCRFSAHRFSLDTTTYRTHFSNIGKDSGGTYPVTFKWGDATVVYHHSGSSNQRVLDELTSEGLQVGLMFVGNEGRVRLIVPFKRGSDTDQTNGTPVYFDMVKYILQ